MLTRNLLQNVVLESKLIQIGPADRLTAPNPRPALSCKLSDCPNAAAWRRVRGESWRNRRSNHSRQEHLNQQP
jgi:hypothetical protein